LVEYTDEGPTLPDLKSKINGYPHCYTVTKPEDDGSKEILAFLAEFPRFVPQWRVCGIHLENCVWDTIVGLKDVTKKINLTIIKDCVSPLTKNKSKVLASLKNKGFKLK
jgi:hypothetical protein